MPGYARTPVDNQLWAHPQGAQSSGRRTRHTHIQERTLPAHLPVPGVSCGMALLLGQTEKCLGSNSVLTPPAPPSFLKEVKF